MDHYTLYVKAISVNIYEPGAKCAAGFFILKNGNYHDCRMATYEGNTCNWGYLAATRAGLKAIPSNSNVTVMSDLKYVHDAVCSKNPPKANVSIVLSIRAQKRMFRRIKVADCKRHPDYRNFVWSLRDFLKGNL